MATHGHASTTGVPSLEYFVSYAPFELPEAQEHYSEKLVTLNDFSPYYKPEVATHILFVFPARLNLFITHRAFFHAAGARCLAEQRRSLAQPWPGERYYARDDRLRVLADAFQARARL